MLNLELLVLCVHWQLVYGHHRKESDVDPLMYNKVTIKNHHSTYETDPAHITEHVWHITIILFLLAVVMVAFYYFIRCHCIKSTFTLRGSVLQSSSFCNGRAAEATPVTMLQYYNAHTNRFKTNYDIPPSYEEATGFGKYKNTRGSNSI